MWRIQRLVTLVLVLAGCGSEPSKTTSSSNNASNNASNNNTSNNTTHTIVDDTAPGTCMDDGWCVEDRHAAFYTGMWVVSPEEIWLAEQAGDVRVGSGTSWVERPVPGIDQISDIIGTNSGEVFVSTFPAGVFRWDGDAWVSESLEEDGVAPLSLAYDSTTDELFGSNIDSLFRRDGQTWRRIAGVSQDFGQLSSVVTCGGKQIFGIGHPFAIEDGFAFAYGIPDTEQFEASAVLPTGEILGVGNQVVWWDTAWKRTDQTSPEAAKMVTGTALNDIWVLTRFTNEAWHYDGDRWNLAKTFTLQRPAWAVFSSTPGQLTVLYKNSSGEVIDTAGEVLETFTPPPVTSSQDNSPVHFVSSDEFYVATTSAGGVAHRIDGEWQVIGQHPPAEDMWASAPDDMWFVTQDEIRRWDGESLRRIDTGLELGVVTYHEITGDAQNVWVLGTRTSDGPPGSGFECKAIQFDGSVWVDHVFPGGSEPSALPCTISVSGDQAVVFRGNETFRWDGQTWHHTGPQYRVRKVGCEDDEVVGLGSQPLTMLGAPLDALQPFGVMVEEYNVASSWMTSSQDAWVIGQELNGRIRHFDGTTWRVSLDTIQTSLKGIQALPTGHVFALGNNILISRPPR